MAHAESDSDSMCDLQAQHTAYEPTACGPNILPALTNGVLLLLQEDDCILGVSKRHKAKAAPVHDHNVRELTPADMHIKRRVAQT